MPDFREAEPGTEAPIYETSPLRLAAYMAAGLALLGALFALGWDIAPVRWVAVILGVVVMITLHELGHFVTAKWSGMKVTEFFIGFGPRLWSFRRGETEYGVKPIPAGAYVRIIGMNNLDEVEPEDEPRSYRQQSFPRRLLVVLAGPATHFVQAGLIIFVLLAIVGVPGGTLTGEAPDAGEWVVDSVSSDSAAAEAGLQSGDRVVAFDGTPVSSWNEMTDLIRETEVGEDVTLTVERDGRTFETATEIGPRPRDLSGPGAQAGSPFLGVGPTYPSERLGVGEALMETPGQTLDITGQALAALGRFFSPSGLDSFADSVSEGAEDRSEPQSSPGSSSSEESSDDGRLLSIFGAIRLGSEMSAHGAELLLGFFLSINIFVGLVNLVPLLPFDGGHAAVAIYERIRSRRGQRYQADVTKLLPFAYAVIMALVVLFVTTSYLDFVDPVDL